MNIKKGFLPLLLFFITTLALGQSKKDNQDLWTLDLSPSLITLSPSSGLCKSFKIEAYGFWGRAWKKERKDLAKSKGKNTYLNFNLAFFNALRYNLYPNGYGSSGQYLGTFSLSVMSAKFFLCFVKNPRIMTCLNLSFEMNSPNSYLVTTLEQNLYYYVFGRCAIGLGIGTYVVSDSQKSTLYFVDSQFYTSIRFLFDF